MAQLDFLGELKRTHKCGELRASDAGKQVVLMGWVNRRRDLGNLIFVDLRDRTGITQVVFDRESSTALHDKASELRNEYVIAVVGVVKPRESVNKNIPTGDIEVICSELRLLNDSRVPPFLPTETVNASEELKLKYRYLDLRRAEMQYNIQLRHNVALAIREYLNSQGFFEIETPFMTRSTPEGARDYLVPSRVHPGEFYALPQSPQIFKQILMISGFDRYFQVARCFRDEDLRADRQPEFTQIDLEMTFPQQNTVFEIVEGFLGAAFKTAGHEIGAPFPHLTYDQAIRLYGIDKPDIRIPAMNDVKECFTSDNIQTLAFDAELPIVAIHIPNVGELSRKERDEIKTLVPEKAKNAVKIIDDMKRLEKGFPEAVAKIRAATDADDRSLLLIAGSPVRAEIGSEMKTRAQATAVYTNAGQLRLALAQKYAERHGCFKQGVFKFLWVTDFPMFEWNDEAQQWDAAHHPFTSPHEEDMDKLGGGMAAVKDPYSPLRDVRALAYDVVLNGTELGSGSIRIHRQDIQAKIFEALGMSEEEQQARFGFFLEALQYGTPPHGGIALGLDRIVMILAGAPSLREVIPFPKTADATDLMMHAPTAVSENQLLELGLMPTYWQLSPDNKKLISVCQQFLDSVGWELINRPLTYTSHTQQAIGIILAKALEDAQAVLKLAKAGYGRPALALSRSIVEAAVNCQYILQDPEPRTKAFLYSVVPEVKTLAQKLRRTSSEPEVLRAFEKADELSTVAGWPRMFGERARALGQIASTYELVFAMASQVLHSSVGSNAGGYSENTGGIDIDMHPSDESIQLPLMIILDFFRPVVLAALDQFGIEGKQTKAILEAFDRSRIAT